jgi:hypothetical protein
MADNKTPTGAAFKVGTREVSYSGETADIQAIAVTTVAGADDAKTATDVSATNPFPVAVKKTGTVVDANNSSTTPLAAAATFTGTGTDCLGYSSVSVMMVTDKLHDLYFDWSTDNTNWDYEDLAASPDDFTPVLLSTPVRARYFRVRAVRGGAGSATVMRLQTLLHTHPHAVDVLGQSNVYSGNDTTRVRVPVTVPTGITVQGLTAAGAGDSFNPVVVAGADGSTVVRRLKTDADGELQVDLQKGSTVVDANNSTTTPLGAGATYTGTATDCLGYAMVSTLVYCADPEGHGIYFEFSSNGTNWDWSKRVGYVGYVAGNNFAFLHSPVRARYFRLRVVNEVGAAESAMRVQTLLHTQAGAMLVSGNGPITGTNPEGLAPIALAAYDIGTTGYRIVKCNDEGALLASGNVAHDAADAGYPVKVGARAIPYSTQTPVAANDRTDLMTDRHGSLFVIGGHPDIITLEAAYTALQTDVAIVSVAGGNKIAVSQIQVLADSANTVFPQVRIGFGATTTPTTTGVVLTHPGLPAGGGVSRGDGSGVLGVGADGEDLRITLAVPTGGSVRVLVTYYVVPS